MSKQQFTRVREVALELNVSIKRVYQMIREGKLEALRIGPRTLRVCRESLRRFLDEAVRAHRRDLGLDLLDRTEKQAPRGTRFDRAGR